MHSDEAETHLLTVPEMAKRLRIGVDKAYELCNRSEFPSSRVGKQIRVPADELDQWLQEGGSEQ